MFERNRSLLLMLVILTIAILVLQVGCARTGAVSTAPVAREDTGRNDKAQVQDREAVLADEELPAEPEVYDLEEEDLQEDVVEDITESMEEIRPADADTFVVDDIVETPGTEAGFDIGYRVQLFATSDLGRARELKKNVMAETGHAVYIEYEGGLYKVRAGDFSGREEAAAARTLLVEKYPDCWIVKTTIRK